MLESSVTVPLLEVLFIVLEFTSQPPMFALAVVSFPVVASIVVIPETDAELNVKPDEFNM